MPGDDDDGRPKRPPGLIWAGSGDTFTGTSTGSAAVMIPWDGGHLGQLTQHADVRVGAPTGVPPFKVHPESAILCLGCGQLFQPSITIHPSGPGEVRYQGETYCPCCSGPAEPTEPDVPTVVRGREDEVSESGIYLIVEPKPPKNKFP